MGNGWHEWPLVLFTVLGQCVAGGVIVAGLGWLAATDNRPQQQRIARAMLLIWLLMGVGFLASTLHLGSPLRAFNALNRIGDSALSNEIASGALFFTLGGLWWLLAIAGRLHGAIGKLWLVVVMLLGLLFVGAMTQVYTIETVPTWDNGYTRWSFFLTVALGGPLLGVLVLRLAGMAFNSTRFATLAVLALLASMAVVLLQLASLPLINSPVQQAATLVPDYGRWQLLRLALLVLGLGCWLCPLLRRVTPRVSSLLAGLLLVVIAELLGRVLFYSLHMTVGMAIAG